MITVLKNTLKIFSQSSQDLSKSGTITNVTYAEALSLISSNLLVKGLKYKITDRGDNGIILDAISSNEFSREGIRLMLCPLTYNSGVYATKTWLGTYNSSLVPNAGELTIWGGMVWENVSGNLGTATDNYSLDAEWTLKTKASNPTYYTELQMQVLYDFTNDWIEKQWDGRDNEVGVDYDSAINTYSLSVNPCDVSDWNYGAFTGADFFDNKCPLGFYSNHTYSHVLKENYALSIIRNVADQIYFNFSLNSIIQNTCTGGNIFNNRVNFIYNNISINGISNNIVSRYIINNVVNTLNDNIGDDISGNVLDNGVGGYGQIVSNIVYKISGNINKGNIDSNTCSIIRNNSSNIINIASNTNSVSSCNISGDIQECNNQVSLVDTSVTLVYRDVASNNADHTYHLDITGLSAIPMNSNGAITGGYAKKITLESTNATETITSFTGWTDDVIQPLFRFIPKSGLTVTFVHNGTDIKCKGAVNAVVNGANEDWVDFGLNKFPDVPKQINIGTY